LFTSRFSSGLILLDFVSKASNANSVGTCAWPSISARAYFDQIGLKRALVQKRLACTLHGDLRTWSSCWTSSNHEWVVFAVRYQQNHRQKASKWGLCVCTGRLDIIKLDRKPTGLWCLTQFGRLGSFFGRAKPTKVPCGNGTGCQQTSILKTVLPNYAMV